MLKWPDLNEFCKANQHSKMNRRIMTEDITHQSCQILKKMIQYLWPVIETLFLYQVELFMIIQPGIDYMKYKHSLEL